MDLAIRKDLMLHAYMFMQSGIPVLYSGDEIAQVNDYTYKDDPNKVADSRYIHRGVMHWDLAEREKRSVYRRRENVPWPAKAGADPQGREGVCLLCRYMDSRDVGKGCTLYRKIL